MDIKKLLEYQSIDVERRNEIKRFQGLDIVKNYNKQRLIIQQATAAVSKLNKDAEETVKQMNSVTERYLEVVELIKDAEKNLVDIEDENEADFYIKNISNYVASLERLAEEAKKVSEKIVKQRADYNKFMDAGKNATQEGKKMQDEYKAELDKSKAVRAGFEAKLTALAKNINPEDLSRYNQIAKDDKYPPIHILKNNYCFCRIEMPGSITQKVKSEGWCICPDCGRILVSENVGV